MILCFAKALPVAIPDMGDLNSFMILNSLQVYLNNWPVLQVSWHLTCTNVLETTAQHIHGAPSLSVRHQTDLSIRPAANKLRC